MSCCCQTPSPQPPDESGCCGVRARVDWVLWISLVALAAGLCGHWLGAEKSTWATYCESTWEMSERAWWGVLVGMLAVGLLARVPRELIGSLLGPGGTLGGILRATAAGTLLDLCNHGILMVGMQLYRKGASLGQTIAFLVSSPWNSLSLTLILASLIGWMWTLVFIALSMCIGIIAGLVADRLVERGVLPNNPNTADTPMRVPLGATFRTAWRAIRPGRANLRHIARSAWTESRMILRWIFLGLVVASCIRAWVPTHIFSDYFGPSWLGLLLTLCATTVIEVCSEGSSPIAADLLTRAAAPGNAFTFLMAGAATDYTEILSLRETTRSWKATLALPLLTTPQVLLVSWWMNQLG